jgi:hypothetical protein
MKDKNRKSLRFPSTDIQKVLHPVDFTFDLSLAANHDALSHRGTNPLLF